MSNMPDSYSQWLRAKNLQECYYSSLKGFAIENVESPYVESPLSTGFWPKIHTFSQRFSQQVNHFVIRCNFSKEFLPETYEFSRRDF